MPDTISGDMRDVAEVIRFLAQSDNRVAVLQVLQSGGRLDRYAIEERVDASRRTVIRTIDSLREQGYVVETGDGYRLTALGSVVVEVYDSLAADVSVMQRLSPFLSHMPAEWFDLDPQVLADADLLVATEGSPYALIDRTLSLRREAHRLRHMSPILEQKSVDQLADRLQAGEDIQGEIVTGESVLASWQDHPEYQDAYELVQAADDLSLYICPDPVPFMLCLTDDVVTVGVAKDGRPYAQIVSDHTAVRKWAETTFASFREQARPLSEY